MSVEVDLKFGTINIPVKVGHAAWEECWEKTARKVDLFGVQESFRRRQRKTWRRLCKKHGWGSQGIAGGPNPVFWDKQVWTKVSGNVSQIHGPSGRKDHPGFNAARYETTVVLRHNEFEFEATVINVHWASKAWVPKWFIVMARIAGKKSVREKVRKHTALGRPVIFMGDTNIYKKINLDSIQWVRGVGIDKLGIAVPAGWLIENLSLQPFPAPTDHKRGFKGEVQLVFFE